MISRISVLAGLAGLTLLGGAVSAADPGSLAGDPASIVRSFNQAVSARDMEALQAHFAAGGVQFNLRPSHGGLSAGPLTSELQARWRMIGPVLFSATSAYTRQAKVQDVREVGDLATVWADIATETVLAGKSEASREQFSELYVLVRTPDGWRIGAVADNRQPDNIGLGGN